MALKSFLQAGLFRGAASIFSYNLVANGFGFLSVSLVANYLSVTEFGYFSTLIAIFLLIQQLTDCGVATVFVQRYSGDDPCGEKNAVFSAIFWSRLIIGVFGLAMLYMVSKPLSTLLFNQHLSPEYLLLAGFSGVLASLIGMSLVYRQSQRLFKVQGQLNLLVQITKLVLSGICLLLLRSECWLVGLLGAAFLSITPLLFSFKRAWFSRLVGGWTILGSLYCRGFWVMLSTLTVLLMLRTDVLMLQVLGDEVDVAVYSGANQVALVVSLISSSLVTVSITRINEYLLETPLRDYLKKIVGLYKVIFSIWMISASIVGPTILFLFFNPFWSDALAVHAVISAAYCIGIFVNPLSLVFMNKDRYAMLTIMNICQLVLNVIVNTSLIPVFGALGAAAATVAVRGFGFIFVLMQIWKWAYEDVS